MPVPDFGGEINPAQAKVVDTPPAKSNNSPENMGGFQDSSQQEALSKRPSSQPKEMPDTSYLTTVTNAQDINTKNPTNSPVFKNKQGDSKPLVSTEGTNSKQAAQKQQLSEKTKQKQVSAKPKQNKPKSDQNQEVRIQLALAKRYYNSSKYQNAIDLLETPTSSSKSNEKLRDLLLLTYTKYANELVSKANLLEAQTILEKAVSIEPKNTELQKQLTKVINTREADRIYQQGLEAVSAGNKTKALQSFKRVLDLNSSHDLAKKQVVKIQGSVIESNYKKAMQHYRKQELNDAISAWTDVLEMDPNHELAKLYRSRAVELKLKIDAINKR